MIRLYIIDDHFLIFEGFCASFDLATADFKVVGGSLTICEALIKIKTTDVDIIILDLFIRQENPVINYKKIQSAFPTIPIVILSQEDCLLWKVEIYRLGVKAYLSKEESKSVMIETLHRVAAGEIVIPGNINCLLYKGHDSTPGLQDVQDYMDTIILLSKGNDAKDISGILKQSQSSIEKKLQKIRQCFHVRTNAELIYKVTIRQNPHLFS